jgi:PLP dependent protein
MVTASLNLQHVLQRIEHACTAADRPVHSVALLAVSKTFGTDAVREVHAAGQIAFGENYVQEAVEKIAALQDLRPRPEWHLIGPLQSNKTRVVAECFDWVHSVDRLKIAERLAAQRPSDRAPLQVCLQVNIDGEATKSGLAPVEVSAVARAVMQLPPERIVLRGLMAIPEPRTDPAGQRQAFADVRHLLNALRDQGLALDTLSMGMSADLEAAVAEGATIVRVGTALFGSRLRTPDPG